MLEFEATFNGQPMGSIEDELHRGMVQALMDAVKADIESAITPSEALQVSINFIGTPPGKISVQVNAPAEILKKIDKVMKPLR